MRIARSTLENVLEESKEEDDIDGLGILFIAKYKAPLLCVKHSNGVTATESCPSRGLFATGDWPSFEVAENYFSQFRKDLETLQEQFLIACRIPVLNSEWQILNRCFSMLRGRRQFAENWNVSHWVHKTTRLQLHRLEKDEDDLSLWHGWRIRLQFGNRSQLEIFVALYTIYAINLQYRKGLPLRPSLPLIIGQSRYTIELKEGNNVTPSYVVVPAN
ncbi:hypothetical protein BDV96DRAFT_608015 [Lophiotrema nucula]|uniref:Uncharacterized protein n=1 Tax=Lophiotrema nucula TaxID=690887 RepID=A0A6A5YFM1_9PLEO|nr:hypothetical protein BDV96DRAFT_608015 [Lophiotrema nucula]